MSKWAVVTGASSGIGAEFARQLSKEGYSLILTARRTERLKELAESLPTQCEIFPADLSKQEECFRLFDAVKDKKIAVFINNAGFGDCSFFLQGELEKELEMIDLNIKAMHVLMKRMLQKFEEDGGEGAVLNVASSAGLLPAGPYMATYYATKAYVTSITQAVAQELKESGSGIYVGALCPGPVDTEFNRVAAVEFSLKGISAKECVRYAIRQMKKKRVIIVPTLVMKLATFYPRKPVVAIASKQQRKKIGR